MYFRMFRFFLRCFRFCLLGFLAFRLLGFSASWLLAFLAFQLLVGLRGFWWLFGFGFSHPLHSQFNPGGFCSFSLVYATFDVAFCVLCFPVPLRFIDLWLWLPESSASPVPPYLNHHFLEQNGGGLPPPPCPSVKHDILCN